MTKALKTIHCQEWQSRPQCHNRGVHRNNLLAQFEALKNISHPTSAIFCIDFWAGEGCNAYTIGKGATASEAIADLESQLRVLDNRGWILFHLTSNILHHVWNLWCYSSQPMEQREQSHARMNFAESWQRSTIGQVPGLWWQNHKTQWLPAGTGCSCSWEL